ncbi:MAG: winged helix-turn-helix domain-containing protein [Phenylobacterium sp.]|uniref:winged helix-turn-helix domain-containing protein n=1 Tax=Phenylobacterium sp. TaxID=1871053 RepID=UPI0025E51A7C|nr:winged helix-turn-helix domain-containing protein [Phenylobacterium sp.]MCG9915571.1 winged helix-turn-helix domain-containing protein [Phenylobacterium sp.]
MTTISLKFDFANGHRLGPGKADLLAQVRAHGSIAAAGRAMGMSYRRAWLLVDQMNQMFVEPVVMTQLGGRGGGSAQLTPFGETVLNRYRALQAKTAAAVAADLAALEAALRAPEP